MASIGPDNTPRPGRVLAATFVGVGAVTLLDRDRDVWMADRVRDEGNSSAREGLLQSRGARAGGDSSEEDGGSRSSRSRGRSSRSRSSRSRSSGRGNRTSSRTGSPQLDAAHRGNDPAAIAHRPDTPATDRSHPPSRSSPLPPSPTPHRSPSSPFDIPSPSLHNNAPSHLFSPPSPPLAPPPPPPPPPRAMHLPLATPFIARSSTDPSTASITPTRLLPLLHCPLCQPPRPLTAPRTLRCGHTLCAAHLSSHPLAAPCPLPACSPAPLPSPAAPAPSRAAAVPYVAAPPPAVSSPPRGTDVTVNKLLALVHRAHAWFEPRPADRRVPAHPHDPDERTDSEDDHAHGDDAHDPGPSSPPAHRGGEDDGSQPPHGPPPRPRSRSPPPRPRKRRRRLRPPRATHVPTPTAPDMDPHARLEKELFAELTCEICFGLLWQPVTTPCQHPCVCDMPRAPQPDTRAFFVHFLLPSPTALICAESGRTAHDPIRVAPRRAEFLRLTSEIIPAFLLLSLAHALMLTDRPPDVLRDVPPPRARPQLRVPAVSPGAPRVRVLPGPPAQPGRPLHPAGGLSGGVRRARGGAGGGAARRAAQHARVRVPAELPGYADAAALLRAEIPPHAPPLPHDAQPQLRDGPTPAHRLRSHVLRARAVLPPPASLDGQRIRHDARDPQRADAP
ncbi:hypothetical protein AcV7_008013 [Taiwanofungus camphoratus]|nr:hypothetical protein AcV7_008013 [Antrodia cinnamomea]